MKRIHRTDEELLDELHRFVRENGRVPTAPEMSPKFGYPAAGAYVSHFGSFNNALETAGLIPVNIRGYDDGFLISELNRFYDEKGRIPVKIDMNKENGFPSYHTYRIRFGSLNNALVIAGLYIDNTHFKITGNEICEICNRTETTRWHHINKSKKVVCNLCFNKPDYLNKNLDKNSNEGKSFVSELVVRKVLNISLKDDCNLQYGRGYPYDLYDRSGYFYINVKDSTLHTYVSNSYWQFTFKNKKIPNTYVLVGFDEDRKNILHVWITDAFSDIVFRKKSLSITNDINSGLKRAKPWEVNAKPYNDILHKMSQKRKETKGKDCVFRND